MTTRYVLCRERVECLMDAKFRKWVMPFVYFTWIMAKTGQVAWLHILILMRIIILL